MTFSRLIAKRFLLKSKVSSSSKITGWIAVVGLAVGCMAMVLSLSVLNGFENRVVDMMIGSFFEETCKSLVKAFTDRAEQVYGPR